MASAVALVLCFSMILGATYAWFTDFTESSGNIIPSGELNAEMYWADEINPTEWKKASETSIFTYENWEPGYTEVKYIKVKNAGDLSFKWRLYMEVLKLLSARDILLGTLFLDLSISTSMQV